MSKSGEATNGRTETPKPSRAGRPRGVWWWAAHKRWCFTVAGKRHKAPKEIGREDRKKADRWYRETLARLYPDLSIPELPSRGRIDRKYRVKAITHRRLLRMTRAEREATGKRLYPGHIIDRLVREASGCPEAAG